nr:reverse transcriptase domain, reverse transcriptase zinc-binding domain protein [Tanacetum cinerariifolium]
MDTSVRIINELTQGMELAKHLKSILISDASPEEKHFLIQAIIASYDIALVMVNWGDSGGQTPPLAPPMLSQPELSISIDESPHNYFGLGCPKPDIEVNLIASSLGCAHGVLPFIYLGLPVRRKMRLSKGWQVIIDRFHEHLSSWKAKSLSVGGRLTLIKSVLGNLLIYYISLFKAPSAVINILEAIRCFCSPINLLGSNGVWIDILKATKKIEAIDLNFKNSFVKGGGRLYALGSTKDCKVKDRGLVVNEDWIGSWDWCIPPRRRALDDLNVLHTSLSLGAHHKWNSWIPKKVNVMVWKSLLDRLATGPNVMARSTVSEGRFRVGGISLPQLHSLHSP